jgi:glycosyltransferase involved in cell wall biosynthesis
MISGKEEDDEMTTRLYAVCLTKNESDIIEFCLLHAAKYCEKIFVLDNGSDDNTWELVNALGRQNNVIVPFEKNACQYGVGLRGYIFNRVRDRFNTGDWVLILDSDEFLEVNPWNCIAYCERRGFDLVFALQAQFYITRKDLTAAWFKNGSLPILSFQDLPKHYLINWKEPRLFRYHNRLVWPDMDSDGNPSQISYPQGLTRKRKRGLLNRHYQYRTLSQMQARIELRADLFQRTGRFKHNREKEFYSYIRDDRRLKTVGEGEIIQPTAMDFLRLHLIRRSKKFKRFFHNRTLETRPVDL